MRFVLAFFITTALSVSPAYSANLSWYSEGGQVIVTLDGDISKGDANKMKQIITRVKNVVGIKLDSGGGTVLESLKLAEVVRRARIATFVPKGAVCASGCFVVFAAGRDKFASYGSALGTHGSADPDGRQDAISFKLNMLIAGAMGVWGVPWPEHRRIRWRG